MPPNQSPVLISIIIPVLNEEAALPEILRQLNQEQAAHEVIVVDGGSTDLSASIAKRLGATVVSSGAGRGNQICRGAEQAQGDILFFLHADSGFPAGGLQRIVDTLSARPDAAGGNFRLVFDGDDSFSTWLTSFYSRLRSSGRYYGDSGIFVRRRAYEAIGGMRPIALMEDLDFVRRLERYGKTCCIMDPPLVTSSRRFHGRWPPGIVYGWVKLHALYWLGVSPDTLARMYRWQQRVPPAKHER
jgi:rSAM/selenodomain-associated transferase 2